MVTKQSSRRQGRSRKKEEWSQHSRSSSWKFKCYYCDEEGHTKRDCPKRKNDLRDEKPLIVEVAESSNLSNGGDVFLVATKSPGTSNLNLIFWLFDSHVFS